MSAAVSTLEPLEDFCMGSALSAEIFLGTVAAPPASFLVSAAPPLWRRNEPPPTPGAGGGPPLWHMLTLRLPTVLCRGTTLENEQSNNPQLTCLRSVRGVAPSPVPLLLVLDSTLLGCLKPGQAASLAGSWHCAGQVA